MHALVIDIKHGHKLSVHSFFFNSFIETCLEIKINGNFSLSECLRLFIHEFSTERKREFMVNFLIPCTQHYRGAP